MDGLSPFGGGDVGGVDDVGGDDVGDVGGGDGIGGACLIHHQRWQWEAE